MLAPFNASETNTDEDYTVSSHNMQHHASSTEPFGMLSGDPLQAFYSYYPTHHFTPPTTTTTTNAGMMDSHEFRQATTVDSQQQVAVHPFLFESLLNSQFGNGGAGDYEMGGIALHDVVPATFPMYEDQDHNHGMFDSTHQHQESLPFSSSQESNVHEDDFVPFDTASMVHFKLPRNSASSNAPTRTIPGNSVASSTDFSTSFTISPLLSLSITPSTPSMMTMGHHNQPLEPLHPIQHQDIGTLSATTPSTTTTIRKTTRKGTKHQRNASAASTSTSNSPPKPNKRPASTSPNNANANANNSNATTPKASKSSTNTTPASIPRFTVKDGIEYLTVSYVTKGPQQEFDILMDISNVSLDEIPEDFKIANCVYVNAMCEPEQYTGKRWKYETEANEVAWKLCWVNQDVLPGKRGLIQRAVDSYRNSQENSKSRRASKLERHNSKAAGSSSSSSSVRRKKRDSENKCSPTNGVNGRKTPKLSPISTSSLSTPELHPSSSSGENTTSTMKRPGMQGTALFVDNPTPETPATIMERLQIVDSSSSSLRSLNDDEDDEDDESDAAARCINHKDSAVDFRGAKEDKSVVARTSTNTKPALETVSSSIPIVQTHFTTKPNKPKVISFEIASATSFGLEKHPLRVDVEAVSEFSTFANERELKDFQTRHCVYPRALGTHREYVQSFLRLPVGLVSSSRFGGGDADTSGGANGGSGGGAGDGHDDHHTGDSKTSSSEQAMANLLLRLASEARYEQEVLCNQIAWRLAYLNPALMDRQALLQRALDAYRDKFF